jgi:hypothetical protein
MSHLSILPTLLRDVDLLAEALADLCQVVHRGGAVEGFAGERVPVLVRLDLVGGTLLGTQTQTQSQTQSQTQTQTQSKRAVRTTTGALSASFSLGWARQLDGTLALVGDLGRIAVASPLQELLSQLSHRYALRQALQAAGTSDLAGAELSLDGPASKGFNHPLAPSLAKPRPRS